jgi:hypothetical protein
LCNLFRKFGSIILKGLVQNKPLEEIIASYPGNMPYSTKVIPAALSAAIPPVNLLLLQFFLKSVDDADAKFILLDGRIRESQAGSQDLQSLTSIPYIGFIDTRNQSLLSPVKCSGLSGIF